ncbi:hypothetical protein DFH28DRAFT_1133358 [Melampsora americana]|nr:hypothetical protein DFH28DRAFT_1133358 [Melampsora americana]
MDIGAAQIKVDDAVIPPTASEALEAVSLLIQFIESTDVPKATANHQTTRSPPPLDHQSTFSVMGRNKRVGAHNSNDTDERPRRPRVKKTLDDAKKFEKQMVRTRNLLSGQPILQPPPEPEPEPEVDINQFMPYDEVPFFDADAPENDGRPVGNGDAADDAAIEEFARRKQEERYAHAREQLRQSWEEIENSITAAYLHCQYITANWTTKHSYLDRTNPDCTCAPNDIYHCNVDLIDVLGCFPMKPVKFCRCKPEAVQLVHQGYLPSTPTQPRTAFSVPLMQLFHNIWKTSVSSATSFIHSLMNFLNNQASIPFGARGILNNWRNLTQPFSSGTHLYSRITVISKEILHHGLQFTKANIWADKCSRCFGPAKNEIKGSEREADYIICMDGNFQHRHNKLASKDTPEEQHYPAIFVQPSQMAKDQHPTNASNADDDPCADAHKAANDTRSLSTWDKCDDTGLFAAACRHDVPLLLANIYQSGEKSNVLPNHVATKTPGTIPHQKAIWNPIQHWMPPRQAYQKAQPSTQTQRPNYAGYIGLPCVCPLVDIPVIARLPTSTRFHRLQTIDLRCEYLTFRRQSATGKWLLRRLKHTRMTITKSQRILDKWCSMRNPHQEGSNYTLDFFREQWKAKRKTNLEQYKDIKVRQRLELGRLLCLEDLLYKTWDKDAHNREHAFDRLHCFQDVAKDILEQRMKIGLSDTFTTLSRAGKDLLLKVWFTKTEVRTRFLALKAKQRPLDPENRVGGGSRLGTHEKERIMLAIQRRTRTLKKHLTTYTHIAQEFQELYPNHPTSPVIKYGNLMQADADNHFWNDGIFTHSEEPWEVDHRTQAGMCVLARLQRGQEELRCLGWEVRRSMRWATHEHNRIWNILVALKEAGNSKIGVAEGMLHNAFVKIAGFQKVWDIRVMEVLQRTPEQVGDYKLMTIWKSQLLKVRQLRSSGCGSTKAGDFKHLFSPHNGLEGAQVAGGAEVDDEAHDLSDVDAEAWEIRVDQGMILNIIDAVGEE